VTRRCFSSIDWERLPRHVADYMDGNGRWAAQRDSRALPDIAPALKPCAPPSTLVRVWAWSADAYAFSTENWKRPRYEVDALMRMLRKYLRIELDEIDRQNIRFQTIGRTEALARNVRKKSRGPQEQTAKNRGMVLSVALNYGGRAEIVDACRPRCENFRGREVAGRVE